VRLREATDTVLAQIPEQVTAEDVMTTTVSTVELDDTMEDALALMERIKKKGLPVVDADGNFKGAIKYKDAVKAVQQGKESQRVKAWARREALTVRRAAPLSPAAPARRRSADPSPLLAPPSGVAGLGLRRDREHLPHTDLRPHRRRRRDRQAAGADHEDRRPPPAQPVLGALAPHKVREGEKENSDLISPPEALRRARPNNPPDRLSCNTNRLTPRPTRRRGR
jgi:hypothetical protein